ncbi:hypothetical protein L7F22_059228 [Adiantum nelumboides]|nr:hypothetical protein [Adiantum nelumboides]
MAAWSVIKQWTQPPAFTSSEYAVCNDCERSNSSNALALYRREDNSSQMQPAQRKYGGRSRVRVVNMRGKNRLSREGSPGGQFHFGASSSPSSPSADMGFEDERTLLFGGQSSTGSKAASSRVMGPIKGAHLAMEVVIGCDPLLHLLQQHLIREDNEMLCANSTTPTSSDPSLARTYVHERNAMASTTVDVKEYPNSYVFIVNMPSLKSSDIKASSFVA